MRVTVVGGIDGGQRVVGREILIDARGSEIFADVLDRIAEGFGDPAGSAVSVEQFGAVRDRPERKERLNAWHSLGPRCGVGGEREIAEAERLAETFVVNEEKCLVFDDRAAG